MDNALCFLGGYGTPRMGIWKTDGTATGTDGTSYVFNYAFNLQLSGANSADPFATTTGVATIVDHFNLLGQAGAPSMKVSFRETFDFTNNRLVSFTSKGDPECDPI